MNETIQLALALISGLALTVLFFCGLKTMNETTQLVLAFIAGLVLGIFFFYGLWLTVKKAVTSRIPAVWIMGSFFLRIGLTLVGFYFVASGNLERMLVCVAGFIVARLIVVHFTQLADEKQLLLKKEVGHEA